MNLAMHGPEKLKDLAEGNEVEPTTDINKSRWWTRPDLDEAPDGD